MSGFDRAPVLVIEPDGSRFVVDTDVVYTGSQGDSWLVPSGYVTDLATIPDALSWAIPKLGAYSRAAIVHDVLCDKLADWHAEMADALAVVGPGAAASVRFFGRPQANAVDTDALFRKIAREHGTDPVTAALLWTGVRWGALANPARRAGWLSTAPAVLAYSVLFAPVLIPATVLAVAGRLVLRVARSVVRLFGR